MLGFGRGVVEFANFLQEKIAGFRKNKKAIEIAGSKKNKRAIEIALASRLCDHSKLKI